ncbi:MAG: hypothetical protein J5614_03495, partial [Paludibacteraceae bacterium]|nr:hypothetical protein [Paludibacteraceae bacterium]
TTTIDFRQEGPILRVAHEDMIIHHVRHEHMNMLFLALEHIFISYQLKGTVEDLNVFAEDLVVSDVLDYFVGCEHPKTVIRQPIAEFTDRLSKEFVKIILDLFDFVFTKI